MVARLCCKILRLDLIVLGVEYPGPEAACCWHQSYFFDSSTPGGVLPYRLAAALLLMAPELLTVVSTRDPGTYSPSEIRKHNTTTPTLNHDIDFITRPNTSLPTLLLPSMNMANTAMHPADKSTPEYPGFRADILHLFALCTALAIVPVEYVW